TTGDGQIHALAYGPPRVLCAPGSATDPGLASALDPGLASALDQGLAQKFGPVDVTSTDVETGREVARSFLGHAPLDEPMELTVPIASRGAAPGVMSQPTLTRMLRIGPA